MYVRLAGANARTDDSPGIFASFHSVQGACPLRLLMQAILSAARNLDIPPGGGYNQFEIFPKSFCSLEQFGSSRALGNGGANSKSEKRG